MKGTKIEPRKPSKLEVSRLCNGRLLAVYPTVLASLTAQNFFYKQTYILILWLLEVGNICQMLAGLMRLEGSEAMANTIGVAGVTLHSF